MVKRKTFDYEGQMVNYFNKVKNNPKIGFCYCGLIRNDEDGKYYYTVVYRYGKKN